jgi:hypothetical protein
MGNLVKTEVVQIKASLKPDAIESIRSELTIMHEATRIDVISSATTRLFSIINNCVNAAYQLGRIDGKNS